MMREYVSKIGEFAASPLAVASAFSGGIGGTYLLASSSEPVARAVGGLAIAGSVAYFLGYSMYDLGRRAERAANV